MIRMRAFLISAVLLAGIASASAQTVPTKTVTLYNNSTDTVFAFIQAPIKSNVPGLPPVRDLWMQAQFKVADPSTQTFQTTRLYRIYVNRDSGIPPGGSVTINVPFYTQLLPTTASNLGTIPDQFIDWWNAMRVFVFDGKDELNAAFNYNGDNTTDPNNVKPNPPFDVNPLAGAAVPTCTPIDTPCDPIVMKAYIVDPPTPILFQLVEYTFADARPDLTIDLTHVNYNISAVDAVYLPVAIGAHGNGTADNTYLGSTQAFAPFRATLAAFTANGTMWPFYIPAYYTAQAPTTPLPNPPAGVNAYPQPKIPGGQTVYFESFKSPPPAPPVLSSDTLSGTGVLGTLAQGTKDLWVQCTTSTADTSTTCVQIRQINQFFLAGFNACHPNQPPPSVNDMLGSVYGWVQFPNCAPLVTIPGYPQAIQTYCLLQYNFFDPSVPSAQYFNPYVKLIHQTLASNAYAYSIDDAVSYLNRLGDGVVITVAGTRGLENPNQSPLPTAATYQSTCGAASTLLAAVLPNARTGFVGGPAVTAFASVINTGTTLARKCSIALPPGVPAVLDFQTTNAQNVPVGVLNAPVDVAPNNATQSFVFMITPSQTFTQDIGLVFKCDNAAAPSFPGINTFLVTITTTPIPDMLSITSTATFDGISNIPGVTGTGVMANATMDINVGGTVTCTATPTPAGQPTRTLAANLSICQTNSQGHCINPATPGASATLTVATGETDFFAVFIQGQGQAIQFDPGKTRVFFLCTQGSVPVGEASVAVRTQ